MRPEADDYPLTVEYESFGGVLLWRSTVPAGAPFPEPPVLALPRPYRMTIKTADGRVFRRLDMAADSSATMVSKLDP